MPKSTLANPLIKMEMYRLPKNSTKRFIIPPIFCFLVVSESSKKLFSCQLPNQKKRAAWVRLLYEEIWILDHDFVFAIGIDPE